MPAAFFSTGDNEPPVRRWLRASRSKTSAPHTPARLQGRRFARLCTSQMEAFVEQCAAMQRRMGELTNEAAEVEPVVDALVKSHAEFEVRKDRYKKALAK